MLLPVTKSDVLVSVILNKFSQHRIKLSKEDNVIFVRKRFSREHDFLPVE